MKKKSSKPGKKAKKPSIWKSQITVELVQGQRPKPLKARLSRKHHGKVRFWNRTTVTRTISFTSWPFTGAPRTVSVSPMRRSGWLRIVPTGPQHGDGYVVTPPLKPGPPGGPEVIGGD